MAAKVDYKKFIEDIFFIKDRYGVLQHYMFNPVQLAYYQTLQDDYGAEMQAIRENILKGRQFGMSSLITAIFAVDFILSELGDLPIIDADIYSHKDEETDAHITRFNLFINSFLIHTQGGGVEDMERMEDIAKLRKAFLRVDNGGEIISRNRGAQYHAQTASAKVSGRGGTKQNIHWSEVAFYPNTEIINAKKLVVGAEKQVPQNFGKIFRETTGNLAGDYFAEEYNQGKDGISQFKSRFIAWYSYPDYQSPAPADWRLPEYYETLLESDKATREQCYWHWRQTRGLEDKEELREYPTYDTEAFLYGGTTFFNTESLIYHTGKIRKPIKEGMYVNAIAR